MFVSDASQRWGCCTVHCEMHFGDALLSLFLLSESENEVEEIGGENSSDKEIGKKSDSPRNALNGGRKGRH